MYFIIWYLGKKKYWWKEEWKDVYPILTDYVPDRMVGTWSRSLVVPWLLLQGFHCPFVETDVSIDNYTNMMSLLWVKRGGINQFCMAEEQRRLLNWISSVLLE